MTLSKAFTIVVSLPIFILNCANNITGIVTGFDSNPVEGAVVNLVVIDDTGETVRELDFDITDSNGIFKVNKCKGLGGQFVLEAVLPSATLRGFAAGDGSLSDVNPITDALVKAIVMVTESANGRTLTDFTKNELIRIARTVVQNSDSLLALDLTDAETLVLALIQSAGRSIPDAAGGGISAVDLASVEAPNLPTDVPEFTDDGAGGCGEDTYRTLGNFYAFDLMKNGALCRVYSDFTGLYNAFDGQGGLIMSITGDSFTDTGTGAFPGDNCPIDYPCPALSSEDGREIVFGPVATDLGLEVTRKVYIPDGEDFARYLEIFSNPQSADIDISVDITGEMGLGDAGFGGIATLVDSSGDMSIDSGDSWAANVTTVGSKSTPTVGFVWDGFLRKDGADSVFFPPQNDVFFKYSWEDVIIPAGGEIALMHYTVISSSRVADNLEALLSPLHMRPDDTGLSSTELSSLQNFAAQRGNISGEAGSVVSYENLTVSNLTNGSNLSLTANSDGSFNANMPAAGGDSISITGSGGFTQTDITVE